jgi:hypothetical protein
MLSPLLQRISGVFLSLMSLPHSDMLAYICIWLCSVFSPLYLLPTYPYDPQRLLG